MSARVVYSSGPGGSRSGAACPRCRTHPCRCTREAPPPAEQSVRVRRERGGRRGKTVTVAEPLLLPRETAAKLLAELKRSCGAGGALKTVTAGEGREAFALELQGDHVGAVLERLLAGGYRAKRSGG